MILQIGDVFLADRCALVERLIWAKCLRWKFSDGFRAEVGVLGFGNAEFPALTLKKSLNRALQNITEKLRLDAKRCKRAMKTVLL